MNFLSPILARGDDGIPGIFVVLVFFAIWAIGAIASATRKKKPQQGKPQPSWQDILRDLAGEQRQQPPQAPPQPQVLLPLPPGQTRPRPAQPIHLRRKPVAVPSSRAPVTLKKKLRFKSVRRVVKPAPQPPPLPAGRVVTQATFSSEGAAQAPAQPPSPGERPSRPRQPAATAASLAKWLKPSTLRQQFILTEIFQPPLTMRPERGMDPSQI
jgi:hypothetical protein